MLINFLLFQIHLMEESRKNGVERFLLVGSICEYPQSLVAKEESAVWDSLPSQNDKYAGVSKRLGELQAQAYFEESSWDAVRIIRPSNVYGPHDDFNPKTAQVIGALISRAVDNKYVKVIGDGKHVRDFVFSDDVAYWALVALEVMDPCDAVNIGSGNSISIKQLTEIIQAHLPDVRFEFTNTGYQGDFIRALSTTKARNKLNYYEKTSLVDGIGKTIRWYSENKETSSMKGKFYEQQ
jgi:GDP-L-fucose synthase